MTKQSQPPRRFSPRAERIIPALLIGLVILLVGLGVITVAVVLGAWPA